jgi:NAD(P)-dependent dehydrogenase (short-subunit alcohol dehydrogenase family)
MRERRHGCIVNVTSVAGRVAFASQSPDAASKWAFEALSECLAQEMRPTSPYVVGEQIRQIVDGDSWQLRYAGPLLQRRTAKTDEQVIKEAAENDAEYKARMKSEFGSDLNL